MPTHNILSTFHIAGKVIVATGGGGVLVGAMARGLASEGAKIAILDLFLEKAQAVADDITAAGGDAIALKADVLDKASLEAARDAILARYGRIDALINGAGGNKAQATTSPDLSFFDLPQDAFQWVFNLNFIGTLLPSQVFGKVMAEQGEGVILNVSSMNAFRPLTRIPAYSAAKAAVSNFTQWLAVHLAQEYTPNLRVNAIAPGFFLTEQNRFLLLDEEENLTPRGRTIIDHTPAGRFGDPDDLLGAVLWLLSPASAFVTGVVLPIDGGFSAFSGV
ncbi:MAG TPA: SDR family oxidoreductase [Anaerolineae bacterium]|nr:SDR family oxidoreductase [Caldilineae bacterium]HID35103.1 SDR family oxidoreductase [Anaerolineae bacterium]HIQ11741.1 SDR family oxidoreductase [Caldilineales bacterium]